MKKLFGLLMLVVSVSACVPEQTREAPLVLSMNSSGQDCRERAAQQDEVWRKRLEEMYGDNLPPQLKNAHQPMSAEAKVWCNPKDVEADARKGDKSAQAMMCMIFSMGTPKPKYFNDIIEWCTPMADTGDVHAERLLSRVYGMGGGGIQRDIAESYFWLGISIPKKDIATKQKVRTSVTEHISEDAAAAADKRIEAWKKSFCAGRKRSDPLYVSHCQ